MHRVSYSNLNCQCTTRMLDSTNSKLSIRLMTSLFWVCGYSSPVERCPLCVRCIHSDPRRRLASSKIGPTPRTAMHGSQFYCTPDPQLLEYASQSVPIGAGADARTPAKVGTSDLSLLTLLRRRYAFEFGRHGTVAVVRYFR